MYLSTYSVCTPLPINYNREMQITFDLKKFKVSKTPASERADLIGQFTDLLNMEREGTKYRKLTPGFVAVKMSHIPVSDLYFFLKRCKEGKSFSKIWFGALKVR